MPTFELTTFVDAPCARVFEVAIDVEVHAASMAASGERPVAGITAGPLGPGDRVTWRGRHFGLWWRLTSQITAYEPPTMFIDEQVAGPFAHWHHAHHFVPDGADRTIMRDVVTFAAPYGLAGRLVDAMVLKRYMTGLIRTRNRHVAAVAAGTD